MGTHPIFESDFDCLTDKVSIGMTSLEVIGAGLGRTSTASLKLALEKLGYNVHHMSEVMRKGDFDQWNKIHKLGMADSEVKAGLENLLGEYSACCDNPACGFVFELAEMNPNAKIILTVRDSAEAWEKSATDTIFRIIYDSRFTPGLLNSMMNWVPIIGRLTSLKRLGVATMDKCSVQGFHPDIKENRVQFYEDWNEFVQHKIPKDRLLVFNAKQGWGPLCEFLGKPIPDGPYPRAPNVSKTMQRLYIVSEVVLSVSFVAIYGGLGYSIYTGQAKSLFWRCIENLQNAATQYLL